MSWKRGAEVGHASSCAVSATKLQRARILLAMGSERGGGGGCTEGVTERTCQHVRPRASAGGGGAGSDGGSGAQASAVASGAEESWMGRRKRASLVQVACSVPPEGRVRCSVDREDTGGRAGAA